MLSCLPTFIFLKLLMLQKHPVDVSTGTNLLKINYADTTETVNKHSGYYIKYLNYVHKIH